MKKLFKNTLFIGILLFVLFFVARFILGQFGLMFRAWINFIWLASSFILFIWGFIKLYNNVQNKIAKRVLSILTAVVIIFAVLPLPFPIGLTLAIDWAGEIGAFPTREYIIEDDGYKIVGYHLFAFWDSKVKFYEYKNSFVVGSHCLLSCDNYDFDNNDGHFYAYDEFHSFTIEDIVENIKN